MTGCGKMEVGKVGVLLGGISSERDVSIRSGRAIAKALTGLGYDVVCIGETEEIPAGLEKIKIDVAFVALHGKFGEDGQVQTLLESKRIPYTGSPAAASAAAFNKMQAKLVWAPLGIRTPESELLVRENYKKGGVNLPLPLAVKPASEGSSVGFTKVTDKSALDAAIDLAFKYDRHVLVESFISGLELTAGILCDQALPVIHIVPKDGCYDFQHKYTKGMTEYICPADIAQEKSRQIQALALKAHQSLGCRDLSRSDFILDKEGTPYILEINTIPGFTETSLLPKAAAAAGISFETLCEKILLEAVKRGIPGCCCGGGKKA